MSQLINYVSGLDENGESCQVAKCFAIFTLFTGRACSRNHGSPNAIGGCCRTPSGRSH